jgi:regulatory protein
MPAPSDSFHEVHKAVSAFDPSGSCKPSRRSFRSDFSEKNGVRLKNASHDAFERIIRLCAVRDRSVQELRERLASDGYMHETIDGCLKRAVDCGLVDDRRFSESLIRSRLRAGKGESIVRRDLKKHGIVPEELEGWPDSYGMDEVAQEERALALLDGYSSPSKDIWAAAFRYLSAKGYSKSIVTRVVRIWIENR